MKTNTIVMCGAALALGIANAQARECPLPRLLDFVVDKKIIRSERALTQGLEFHNGKLYESTGRILGETRVNTISLDGKVATIANLSDTVFGEGLTIHDGEVFQLTWQENVVFVYDLSGNVQRQMENPFLGWGLANNGKELLFTDGEGWLRYANPTTFEITKEIKLRTSRGISPTGMNELEYVGGKLYGNVFMTDRVIEVNPENGCVQAEADLSSLRGHMSPDERATVADSPENVLNGIAHDPQTGTFYVTGKRWPVIFSGHFMEERPIDVK